MKIKRDQLTGAVLILLGIVVFMMTTSFSIPITGAYPGPRMLPTIAAFGFAVCGLGILVNGTMSKKEEKVYMVKAGWIRIGFLPGMGAGLSNLVAYSSARNASKTPEMFGKGCPDGIWASEVSNNAAIGGSMIPMAALGIPGDSTTALLIGALTIHGLEMGPMVFKNSGNVVYLMFATVMVCALVVLVLQALGMRVFPLILKVPYHYM